MDLLRWAKCRLAMSDFYMRILTSWPVWPPWLLSVSGRDPQLRSWCNLILRETLKEGLKALNLKRWRLWINRYWPCGVSPEGAEPSRADIVCNAEHVILADWAFKNQPKVKIDDWPFLASNTILKYLRHRLDMMTRSILVDNDPLCLSNVAKPDTRYTWNCPQI